jgi:hypothetical protein
VPRISINLSSRFGSLTWNFEIPFPYFWMFFSQWVAQFVIPWVN